MISCLCACVRDDKDDVKAIAVKEEKGDGDALTSADVTVTSMTFTPPVDSSAIKIKDEPDDKDDVPMVGDVIAAIEGS